MPGPSPPRPPGGPPPRPAFMPPPPMKSGSDDLLNSIRKGATLKKTVTVDKSAPMISTKISNITSGSHSNTGVSERVPSSASSMTNGLGLGVLFPDGIPKLKPTGRNLGGPINHIVSNNNINNSQNNNQRTPDTPMQHQKSFAVTQKELKKQMASDSRNREPPPPAPIRNLSNADDLSKHKKTATGSNAIHHNSSIPNIHSVGLETNSSSLHKKASSNTNLRSYDRSDSTDSPHNNLPSKLNFGKPNLAPKPPTLNGKPKKLSINGKPVSRTQSMKTPRSPSPQSPENKNANFSKVGTMKHFSPALTESLSSIYQQKTRPVISERPKAPPPSIPHHYSPSTPPPPSKINIVKHPGHAPPPHPVVQPPIHAPPLPLHRTAPQVPSRAPPAIPINSNGNAPPPAGRQTSSPTDFEVKFANHIHDVSEFPRPDVFRGFPKNYSSKQVGNKQQAPLPPNHIQLNSRLWDSSAC